MITLAHKVKKKPFDLELNGDSNNVQIRLSQIIKANLRNILLKCHEWVQ